MSHYDADDSSQGCGQIEDGFSALTKDDFPKPYISVHDIRSSKVRADDVGHYLYPFDIRYQESFTAAQPIKVQFKFDGVVPIDINGYAL